MLTQLDENDDFVIYSDVLKLGLRCVFMHNGNVIVYDSRQLKKKVMATLLVRADHKNLKYLITQSDLNLRQKRWMEYLKAFNFQLFYHPRKANIVVE